MELGIFVVGFFLGGLWGMFATALVTAGKRANERIDKIILEMEERDDT